MDEIVNTIAKKVNLDYSKEIDSHDSKHQSIPSFDPRDSARKIQ
jgi:hypothetical protein